MFFVRTCTQIFCGTLRRDRRNFGHSATQNSGWKKDYSYVRRESCHNGLGVVDQCEEHV